MRTDMQTCASCGHPKDKHTVGFGGAYKPYTNEPGKEICLARCYERQFPTVEEVKIEQDD